MQNAHLLCILDHTL